LAILLLTGCSLRPKEPVYRYYVLTPELASATSAGAHREDDGNGDGNGHRAHVVSVDAPSLVVGRITIPDYLGREAMATRIQDQRLEYSKVDRWAEPLEEGIARTLRHDLGAILWPEVRVQPRRFANIPTYSVAVDFLRFERRGPGDVELNARYEIHSQGKAVHVATSRAIEPTSDASAAAAAEALSRTLGRLSMEIGAAVRALPAGADSP